MKKDNSLTAKITAAVATLGVVGGGIAGFWEQICPVIGICPEAPTEVVAPSGTTTNKEVTLDGSATSEGGDASGSVEVGDLNL